EPAWFSCGARSWSRTRCDRALGVMGGRRRCAAASFFCLLCGGFRFIGRLPRALSGPLSTRALVRCDPWCFGVMGGRRRPRRRGRRSRGGRGYRGRACRDRRDLAFGDIRDLIGGGRGLRRDRGRWTQVGG